MVTVSRNHTSTQLEILLKYWFSLPPSHCLKHRYVLIESCAKLGNRLSTCLKIYKILCKLIDTYMS